ncbi:hypothetical protein [Shimia abyssi]|uniref:Uncharacterized protein n=1 Tax=Shimia abyssi TaxID=1662395 RepID=A0A2P8FEP9_9RHOB|nr:hypothetical protein [Shimia abyssi]PSL20200.1 hypothetical protein CLV88_104261 [Shimia abyssi]
MKRLCFLGNSHVAAVRLAIGEMQEYCVAKDVEIDVFGSQRNSLRAAEIKNGVVTSSSKFVRNNFQWTSGGMSELDIGRYDEIVVLAGLSLFSSAHYQANAEVPFVSSGLADAILAHRVKEDWAINLAREIAQANRSVTVTHIGSPLISTQSPRAKKFISSYHEVGSEFGVRAKQLKTLITQKVAALGESNFRFSPPPSAALEDSGFFTEHVYCQGSVLFTPEANEEHKRDDFSHMNAKYGRLVVEHVLS